MTFPKIPYYRLVNPKKKTKELLDAAYSGDKKAQDKISRDVVCKPDNKTLKGKLKEFAYLGWEEAQRCYSYGLATGRFGIDQDPVELERIARLDWAAARYYYLEGVGNGKFGIDKNEELEKELRNLWGK